MTPTPPDSGASARGPSRPRLAVCPRLLIWAAALLLSLSACATTRHGNSATGGPGSLPIPPGIARDNVLFRAGFLDATLYHNRKGADRPVDPKGVQDSTRGLQDALDDAYEYGLTLYLPRGTYLVSDTLRRDQAWQHRGCAEQFASGNGPGAYGTPYAMRKAPAIVGQSGGTRPLIVLRDGSPGFDTATANGAKPIVYLRNAGEGDERETWTGDDSCGFGLVFRGVDIKTGRNRGAVALQIPAAQYSYIEDVRIDASGGYAGIRGLPGRTNSATNVAVTGGQFGIIVENGRGFNLVGIDLQGQTTAALSMRIGEMVAVTAFRFAPADGGVAVDIPRPRNGVFLQDGFIAMPKGTRQPVIRNAGEGGFVMRDVTVQTDGVIAAQDAAGQLRKASGQPQRIDEYAYSPDTTAMAMVVNGQRGKDRVRLSVADGKAERAAAPLTRRSWQTLPSFDEAGVVNVQTLGAKGDGRADDTAAIQRAIDRAPDAKVFLPRGDYRITKPLVLGLRTRLFGVPGYRSRIAADFESATPEYAIRTVADPAGTASTYLGDISILLLNDTENQTSIGGVLWQAGGTSLGRQVAAGSFWRADPKTRARQLLKISGSRAGGNWFGFIAGPSFIAVHPDYRGILIEDTAGPVNLYGPNAERSGGRFNLEINRASNVSVFGTKTETTNWPGKGGLWQTPFALVQKSSNVVLGGFTGTSIRTQGRTSPMDTFQIIDSSAVTAAVINWAEKQKSTAQGAMLIEQRGGQRLAIPGSQNVVLFRRD
ncbi:hypothetical protein EWI61_03790 [Methylolobus aquaticus]|nr:hypothetical protein EWI61_03790 [Methylolobus aquaticus]